jgi:Leo1-like protein
MDTHTRTSAAAAATHTHSHTHARARTHARAQVFVTRMPNVMGIKTAPFDPETFDQVAEDETFKFTTNIIRWRHRKDAGGAIECDDHGEPVRETNTRHVYEVYACTSNCIRV